MPSGRDPKNSSADTEIQPEEYSPNEFVLENGILMLYNGVGGDVTVPRGLIMIGSKVFIKVAKTYIKFPFGSP